MEKDSKIYLKNMLDKAQEAIEYCSGFALSDFTKDSKTQSAVMMKLIVIGEEAKKLPKELMDNINLPWKDIIGFKNIAVHKYFDIDMLEVWKTVQSDLPELISQISKHI